MDYEEALSGWGAPMPDGFATFMRPGAWYELVGPPVQAVPGPPLAPARIAAVRAQARDWELPDGVVPIMGDFDDLVCLDLRQAGPPGVVLFDDYREEWARFESWEAFVAAVRPELDHAPVADDHAPVADDRAASGPDA